jgi:hypothetical protein
MIPNTLAIFFMTLLSSIYLLSKQMFGWQFHWPHEMLSWKSGNLGLTILGLWYMVLAFLTPAQYGVPTINYSPNQGILLFGIMFLSISLVNAKSRPTMFGSVFAMLIGLCYFMGLMTGINPAILWTLSLALFAGVLVFELDIVKFGPTNIKAKMLTIVPLAIIGFSLILALVGYNPVIKFNWNYWMSALNLLSVMILSWLYVFEYIGYKPLKGRTNLWLNILALLAVVLSLIGVAQGSLFAW